MNRVVTFVVFALLAIQTHEFYEEFKSTRSNEPGGYGHIVAEVIDQSDNVCKLMIGEEVYRIDVRYFENDESNATLAGRWEVERQRILLSMSTGLDIDTVAHEVSHAVDSIMDEYQFQDEHYEAYLQGRLTRCIWEIVDYDINPPEKEEKFRFSN